MRFETIRVRALSPEEIRDLTTDDVIYVKCSDFLDDVLVPASVTGEGHYYLKQNSVEVHSIYGDQTYQKFGQVYTEDEQGSEMALMGTAGTRVSSTLFFPGIEGPEAKERLLKAIRTEFGPGVVEAWNLRTGLVRNLRWNVYAVMRDRVPVASSGQDKKNPVRAVVETSRRLLAREVWDGHEQHLRSQLKTGEELHTELYDEPTVRMGAI